VSKPYDATVKDLIAAFPADWLGALGVPVRGPVEVLSPELSTVTAAADALLRVGDMVVHIDAESGPDAELAVRLGLYNLLAHRHTGLPVHTVAVLLRPNTGVSGRQSGFGYSPRPSGELTFRYETLRVWETESEDLMRGGIGTTPLATIGRPPHGRSRADAIPEYIGRIGERAVRELSTEMASRLATASLILGGMYLSDEQTEEAIRRLPSMIQSSAWAVFEKLAEASILRRTLVQLATEKFGPPTAEQQAKVDALSDPARLQRVLKKVLTATSWDVLLRTR
jgi:hypothetical protein